MAASSSSESSPAWIPLEEARDAALRDLRAIVVRCESLTDEDWLRPTPCEGWTIADLIGHLAPIPGYTYFAGRLRAARTGTDGPSTNGLPILRGTREDVVRVLRGGLEEFEAEVALLRADDLDRSVPILPGRTQYLPAALAAYVWEFGIHRYDLERAMGNTIELAADVRDAVVAISQTTWRDNRRVDSHVPRFAKPAPDEPVSYVLAGDTLRWEFSFTPGTPVRETSPTRNGNWSSGIAYPYRVCAVEGNDSAACLVLCGRLSTHEPPVSGSAGFVPRKFTVW